jgi:sec-independent protein translocase protein TatA
MPLGIGIWEILVLLGVLLLVFGPRRLPEMGRSLGSGVRELRESLTGQAEETERIPTDLEGTR